MSNINKALNKLSAPDLLNLVDKLREIGIQDEIPLPQIIVVGSQSSGKSSVLEAISRLSFPRGQGLTTTFATEIALRKSPNISIRARIIPGKGGKQTINPPPRKPAQEDAIRAWSRTLTELNADDIGKLVTDAREIINKNSSRGPMSFSFDKLRIEASGPDFPLLTLIDLPGLILTPNDNQTKQDVQDAEAIVKHYMKNQQSLMLAIISAETEMVNQLSLELAQEFDPKGSRTIGVITKPDLLPTNHPRIKYLVQCARGEIEQRKLAHGWFVLKNRNFDAIGVSAEQRDKEESSFFKNGGWADVGSHRAGVDRLRTTLSRLQEATVRSALPSVLDQVDKKLRKCQADHQTLGAARVTEQEQRFYLDKIALRFTSIVEQAVRGEYMDKSFFRLDNNQNPKLRALLRHFYLDFVEDIELNGQTWVVLDDALAIQAAKSKKNYAPGQEFLTRAEMIKKIELMDDDSKGFNFEGMVHEYQLVEQLFEEQATKWEAIAKRHIRLIYDTALEHVNDVAYYLASSDTAAKIQSEILRKGMIEKNARMIAKVEELVAPYQNWKPLTMNSTYWDQLSRSESLPMLQFGQPTAQSGGFGQSSAPSGAFGQSGGLFGSSPPKENPRTVQAKPRYAACLNHLQTYYKVRVREHVRNDAKDGTDGSVHLHR